MRNFTHEFFENLNKFMQENSLYISNTPESFSVMGYYKEFPRLLPKFTAQNNSNIGDIPRLWSFVLNCNQVLDEGVEGDLAEVGVYRGNTSSILAYYASITGRKLYMFDTFSGFDKKDLVDLDADKSVMFKDTSIDIVKSVIGEYFDYCEVVKGYFPDSVTSLHEGKKYSLVSLDSDVYESTKAGLEFFYPRLSIGGVLFLHDYSTRYWIGCKKAIDDFCSEHKEYLALMPDKYGSAILRKTHE